MNIEICNKNTKISYLTFKKKNTIMMYVIPYPLKMGGWGST